MRQADEKSGEKSIDSLSVGDATAVIESRPDAPEPVEIKRALDYVTEDGVVSWEAADEALGLASKVVSTPESRVEFAALALEEANETAEPVSELDTVEARLAAFETRLTPIEAAVTDLSEDLTTVIDHCNQRSDLFEVARRLNALTNAANRAQAAADDLKLDVEAFERWVTSHEVRMGEFADDVDAVDASIESFTSTVEEVAELIEYEAEEQSNTDEEAIETAWVTAAFEHQTLTLVLKDLQAELDDIRQLAAKEGIEEPTQGDTATVRLDRLSERTATAGGRLTDLALPAWRERYGDDLKDLEAELAAFVPPIEWGAVDATLREYRTRIETRH